MMCKEYKEFTLDEKEIEFLLEVFDVMEYELLATQLGKEKFTILENMIRYFKSHMNIYG